MSDLSPAEIEYGRAAVAAGWIAHERLLALSQTKQPGVDLRTCLVAAGALSPEQDRQLLAHLGHVGPPTPDSGSWPSQASSPDSASWPSDPSRPGWPTPAAPTGPGRRRSGSTTAGSGLGLPGASLPEPGDRLGPYTIDRELARGGLGAVFVAHDPQGEAVALKVLLNQAQGKHLKRFEREATVGMRLKHPGICAVLDFGEHEGVAYLTMPFLEGATPITVHALACKLDQRAQVGLLAQVAAALHAAHEAGTVHRDLKPGNVLVTPSGQAKVVDFGLVKDLERSRLTESGQVMGTPHYMAPEQVMGDSANVDRRCDVFALGVILYELIAGRRPFDSETSVGIMNAILNAPIPDLSKVADPALPGLIDVIEVACAKDPDQRYPSAEALRADLQALLDGGVLSERVRARRRSKGRRRLAGAGAAIAALVALGLGGAVVAQRMASPLLGADALAERSAALADRAERLLSQTRSLIANPPPPEWRSELDLLEQSAAALDPDPPEVALARERVLFLTGAVALAEGRAAAARDALAALPVEAADPRGLRAALAGALVAAGADPEGDASAAVEALARAVTAGVRLPELRGWRARAMVRAGLTSTAEAEAAELDLAALGRARPLTADERVDVARICLFTGKPQQASEVLADVEHPPADVADGLTLARVALEISQQAPDAALALLGQREGPWSGHLALRQGVRDDALRAASPTVRAYERKQPPADAERDALIGYLRIARAVLPDEPLPDEVLTPLLTAATTGNAEFVLAVALADLLPEAFEVQRQVAMLITHKSAWEVHQDLIPDLTRAAERARDHPHALELPPEEREQLVMLQLKGLLNSGDREGFLETSLEVLPDVVTPLARNELFEQRAVSFMHRQDWDEALAALEQALDVDPDDKKLHDYRYQCLNALGRVEEAYGEALAYLRSGLEVGTANQFAAGVFVWERGYPLRRYDDVLFALEAVLRDDENRRQAGWWTRAIELQLRAGKVARAQESLREALKAYAAFDFERANPKAVRALRPQVEAAAALLPDDPAGALEAISRVVERLETLRDGKLRP